MVVIVSWPGDDHVAAVQEELGRLGTRGELVDLSRFPSEAGVAIEYDGERCAYRLLDAAAELRLDRAAVVWWRRPQPFTLHPEIAEGGHASFAYNECVEAFAGLWRALDCAWVNHPDREEAAARKVLQLRVAQRLGLEIPRTLITNDPVEAASFVEEHGPQRVAYKAFLPATHDWRETRILRGSERAELASVRYAPVIFQEYVPARLDLRVTAVGAELFATAIHSPESAYAADYRMDLAGARVEPFDLPAPIRRRLRALLDRLGLVYGAIDMRLTPDGRFVFLEVNPSGQWLFVEERSGQPITAALARLLVRSGPTRQDGPFRPPAKSAHPSLPAGPIGRRAPSG